MAEPRFVVARAHLKMLCDDGPEIATTFIKVFEQDAPLIDVVNWAASKESALACTSYVFASVDIEIQLESI